MAKHNLLKGGNHQLCPPESWLVEIPLVAHEFATLLQFGTSYELVNWLAKRLQHASNMLTQEHKDREMIQRAMLGMIEPEQQ